MTYKTYSLILLGGILIVAVILCGATLYYQPIVGDLTRLGGYTENDFGWNGEERVFRPPLAELGNIADHYDIVVIGDSFSTRTTPDRQTSYGAFWTDFLAELTGLSVGVFDLDQTSIEKLVASSTFRLTPPMLVIYESVERALDARFLEASPICAVATAGSTGPIRPHPRGLSPIPVRRSVVRHLNEKRFNETIDHFNKSIRRWRGKNDGTPVMRIQLSKSDLFTHAISSDMLMIADDLRKKAWTGKQIEKLQCALLQLQQTVEANRATRFVAMIAPDKSTVYKDYLPPAIGLPPICPILAADAALHLVCLDEALKGAVASGAQDVYFPNDTHWTSLGAELAGQAVTAYISRDAGRQR